MIRSPGPRGLWRKLWKKNSRAATFAKGAHAKRNEAHILFGTICSILLTMAALTPTTTSVSFRHPPEEQDPICSATSPSTKAPRSSGSKRSKHKSSVDGVASKSKSAAETTTAMTPSNHHGSVPPSGVESTIAATPKMTTGASQATSRVENAPADAGLQPYDPAIVCGEGCYQRMALFCGQLAGFVFLSQHMSILLTTTTVDHWCKPPPTYANLSPEGYKNISIPREEDGSYSHCTFYDPPLTVPSLNRSIQYCSSWDFDRDVYSETLVTRWSLVCDRSGLVSLYSAMYMSGAMAAVPVAGMLSDRIGRKPVITFSFAILLLSGLAACFPKTFIVYVFARFMVSGATATIRIMTFLLLFEVATPDLRFFHCTAVQAGLVGAVLFVNVLKELQLSSTLVEAILMIPAACLVCTFYMLEESPRWLVATSDFRRAEWTLLWAAKMNGVAIPEATRRWKHMMRCVRRREDTSTVMVNSSVFELVRSDTLKQRSVILFFCWTVLVLTYYELLLNINQEASDTGQLLSALSLAPALCSSYFLMENVGRRWTFFFCLLAVGALTFVLLLPIELDLGAIPKDVLIITINVIEDVGVSVIYVYTVELYPTVVRSAGVSASFLFGRVGSLLAPLLKDVGFLTHYSVPLVVVGIANLLSAFAASKLPETRRLLVVDNVKELNKQIQRMQLLDLRTSPIRGRRPVKK